MGKLFWNRWSVLSLLCFTIVSLLLYAWQPSIISFSWPVFLLAALFSLLLWNLIGELLHLLPKPIEYVLIGIVSLLIPLLFASGFALFKEFKVFLNKNLIGFVFKDPDYFTILFGVYFKQWTTILLYLLVAAGFFILLTFRVKERKASWIKVVILLLVVGIGQNQFGKYGNENFTPIDTTFLFAYKDFLANKKAIMQQQTLKASSHRVFPLPGKEQHYNIVVVVNESMSAEPLKIFGYEKEFLPFVNRWYNSEKQQFVLFHNALSISGCTDMSIPTLFSGLSPTRPYAAFMEQPFMWDFAKANGYTTAFFTSQLYTWRNFRYYFQSKGLDLLFAAKNTDLPYVNDVGIDDIAQARNVVKYLNELPKDNPYFLVYNTNALHLPGQPSTDETELPDSIQTRWEKAYYIVDKAIETVVDKIKKRGEMDKTIFIFTADHGQYTAKRQSRLGSFYREALHIPIFVSFPKSWIKAHPDQFERMRHNRSIRISNLDLYPTVVQLLQADSSNQKIVQNADGNSLFDSLTNHRRIVCLSTNSFRRWSEEGLGIYQDSLSYIIDNHHHEQLYNLLRDSSQTQNLLRVNTLPQNYQYSMDTFHKAVKQNPALKRIYDAYRK